MNRSFAMIWPLIFGIGAALPGIAGTVVTLAASQDAWIVDSETFRDINQGFDQFLWIDGPIGAASAGLVSFDLTPLGTAPKIISAKLKLYHQENQQFGQFLRAYRNLAAWDETTVTAGTAPAFGATPVAELLVQDDHIGLYREWEITAIVQAWVAGTYLNDGLRMGKDGTGGGVSPYFASRESALGMPQLVVDFQPSGQQSPQSTVPEPATGWAAGCLAMAGFAGSRFRK